MKKTTLTLAIALCSGFLTPSLAQAEDIASAITEGKIIGDFRLRYESNDQANNLSKEANALTLRSRLGFETAPVYGLSFLIEGTNTSALIDEYAPENVKHDVVGDPTDSALNRIQLTYERDGISAIVGRQRILLDNNRFVGNVGWRQQEQTYDAIRLGYKVNDFNFQYAFINQVHTPGFVNNEAAHNLINISYSGLEFATLTGYGYLLKDKEALRGAQKNDTFGVRATGKQKLDGLALLYTAEFATQKTDNFSANYLFVEGGVLVSGVTAAVGFESLGSDNNRYGFQTPLATKHAFNGWADQFLTTPINGLNDLYVKLGTKVADINLLAFYHDYSSAEGNMDYGSEIDLQATYDFGKRYSVGAKYATYSKGDVKTDDDKVWAWVGVKF